MPLIMVPALVASCCQRRSSVNNASASGPSFFSGWRVRPGTRPATNQLRKLSSKTQTQCFVSAFHCDDPLSLPPLGGTDSARYGAQRPSWRESFDGESAERCRAVDSRVDDATRGRDFYTEKLASTPCSSFARPTNHPRHPPKLTI